MANCPFTGAPCPEHNKEGGCALYLTCDAQSTQTSARMEGCALVLSTLMQVHSVNNMAAVVDGVGKVQAEVSSARVESLQGNGLALKVFELMAKKARAASAGNAAASEQVQLEEKANG